MNLPRVLRISAAVDEPPKGFKEVRSLLMDLQRVLKYVVSCVNEIPKCSRVCAAFDAVELLYVGWIRLI